MNQTLEMTLIQWQSADLRSLTLTLYGHTEADIDCHKDSTCIANPTLTEKCYVDSLYSLIYRSHHFRVVALVIYAVY